MAFYGRKTLNWTFLGPTFKAWPSDIIINNWKLFFWWNQIPTLYYAMEKVLKAFKPRITPAQPLRLLAKPKDPNKNMDCTFPLPGGCSGSVGRRCGISGPQQHTTNTRRVVLMTKVDGSRTDYLQQSEELTHLAQAWESVTKKQLPRGVASATREPRFCKTRRCHECGEGGHLRRMRPNRSNGVSY